MRLTRLSDFEHSLGPSSLSRYVNAGTQTPHSCVSAEAHCDVGRMFTHMCSRCVVACLHRSLHITWCFQDCGTDDGTLVVLYPPGGGSCAASANQAWEQRPPPLSTSPRSGVGTFALVNPATGKCLDEYSESCKWHALPELAHFACRHNVHDGCRCFGSAHNASC